MSKNNYAKQPLGGAGLESTIIYNVDDANPFEYFAENDNELTKYHIETGLKHFEEIKLGIENGEFEEFQLKEIESILKTKKECFTHPELDKIISEIMDAIKISFNNYRLM